MVRYNSESEGSPEPNPKPEVVNPTVQVLNKGHSSSTSSPLSVDQAVGNISSVKQMQNSIIGLSKQFLQLKDPQDHTGFPITSYLTNSFISKSTVKGTADNSPENKNMSEFDKLTNSLQAIGAGKNGAVAADGSWGPKTNNALKNICAILYGMKEFTKTFHLPVQFPKELDELPKLVPNDPTQLQEKNKTATEITKLVTDISNIIPEFIKQVNSSTELKKPIPQQIDFQTTNTKGLLSSQEKELLAQNPSPVVTYIPENITGFSNKIPVRLTDLLDASHFQKFISINKLDKNTILDHLENSLKDQSRIIGKR